MGLKATDRPTGMHEARGPTLADARAGRPMPLFSLPPSRNTHTLFIAKKYAREAKRRLENGWKRVLVNARPTGGARERHV